MRDHSRVTSGFWTGNTGKRLRGHPDAQVVAFYLVTCPASNMIGLYWLPLIYIVTETGLSEKRVDAALAKLCAEGFACYDAASEHVWVCEMASHQIGESLKPGDKRRIAVAKQLRGVRATAYHDAFLDRYAEEYQLTVERRGIEGASKGVKRGIEGDKHPPLPAPAPAPAPAPEISSRAPASARGATAVVEHLNRTQGRELSKPGSALKGRLRDGATVADCCLVLDYLALDSWWRDRPERLNLETPFRADQWESRLEAARGWETAGRPATGPPARASPPVESAPRKHLDTLTGEEVEL